MPTGLQESQKLTAIPTQATEDVKDELKDTPIFKTMKSDEENADISHVLGYEVGPELGKSLSGKVYLCTDTKSGRKYAVKTSNRAKLATKWESPEEEWRLMRLATKKRKGSSSLPGPEHILTVCNFVKTKEWTYTVLEYCPRGDLFELVSKVTYFEEPVARIFFRQLLFALKHIHSYGIFHLDVSLENLFLDEHDVLRLADFGCARRWAKGKRANFGKFRPGKWQYMAPEIFTWKPCYGELVDIWSAGVCLFILLTGKAPFRIPSDDDLNFRRVFYHNDFSRCDISETGKDFLSRMLCPPDERYRVDDLLFHPWMYQIFPVPISSTVSSTSTITTSTTTPTTTTTTTTTAVSTTTLPKKRVGSVSPALLESSESSTCNCSSNSSESSVCDSSSSSMMSASRNSTSSRSSSRSNS